MSVDHAIWNDVNDLFDRLGKEGWETIPFAEIKVGDIIQQRVPTDWCYGQPNGYYHMDPVFITGVITEGDIYSCREPTEAEMDHEQGTQETAEEA